MSHAVRHSNFCKGHNFQPKALIYGGKYLHWSRIGLMMTCPLRENMCSHMTMSHAMSCIEQSWHYVG